MFLLHLLLAFFYKEGLLYGAVPCFISFSDIIALDSGILFLLNWLYSVLVFIHFDAHVSKYDQWEPFQAGSCALMMSLSVFEHFRAVTTRCFRHSLCFSCYSCGISYLPSISILFLRGVMLDIQNWMLTVLLSAGASLFQWAEVETLCIFFNISVNS